MIDIIIEEFRSLKLTQEDIEQNLLWLMSEADKEESELLLIDFIKENIKALNLEKVLIVASDYGRLNLVKFLIEEKEVNVQLEDNLPVKMACKSMKFNTVNYLIENGANLDVKLINKYKKRLEQIKSHNLKLEKNNSKESA